MDQEQLREHLAFASELGVEGVSRDPAWRRRDDALVAAAGDVGVDSATAEEPAPAPITLARSVADLLAAIKTDLGPDCSRCKLHGLGRTQVVFGVGNPEASLMSVGEAPGA